MTARRRLGVLASHEGTTLQAVIDACAGEDFPWEIAVVISNNADAGALRRARAAGVPARHLSSRTHEAEAALDDAIRDALDEHRVDLVLLAGYMRKLGANTLSAYRGRVLNTHPALLPRFGGQGMYGLNVHRAVLAAGEAVTGVSVHLVDAEYDTGPVIAQAPVPVEPGDTAEMLAARVQTRERRLVVEVLRAIPAVGLPLAPGQRLDPTVISPDQTILWRRLDRPGHESARLAATGSGWRLEGSAVFAHEGEACRLDYAVLCDASWRTVSASVAGWIGRAPVEIAVSVDAAGRWRLGGRDCPEVTGAIDVDLNWSPSTNLLPIRRLGLAVGQEADVRAAWLRFPSLVLEPLEQRYRRLDERTYRYESAGGSFVADLEVNAAGLVLHYPGFARADAGI